MKAVLLDIDGTTLLGPEALPGAAQFIHWLRAEGLPHLWLTNNTSMSRSAWLDRLAGAGLEPRPEEIYTAGDATIDYLGALETPPRIALLGTRDLQRDFEAAGLDVVAEDAEPGADTVVLAYDTELTYDKLRRAALLLQAGAMFYATHPDDTCPTPAGPIPDVGSFIALFEQACARRPHVLGKPEATMVAGALARLGIAPEDALMVGDRLATDIRMAVRAGIPSCLVLTGVTDAESLAGSADQPTMTCGDLGEVHAWVRRTRG